eukprot:gene35207-43404_t
MLSNLKLKIFVMKMLAHLKFKFVSDEVLSVRASVWTSEQKALLPSAPPTPKQIADGTASAPPQEGSIATIPAPILASTMWREADSASFKALIEADTPFGRIARPFFNGNDDEFRNNRFKLIPKVTDGNFVVRMAVKDTPTLLGNKLKQYYHKGENYFELDVDVGSSAIAKQVGNEEEELPEILMGCCTCAHVDVRDVKKL